MSFRLTTNDMTMTASAIDAVFRCIGRRIAPSDQLIAPEAFYREGESRASAGAIKAAPDAASDRRSGSITLICRGASIDD
jgi:hypothetical protein